MSDNVLMIEIIYYKRYRFAYYTIFTADIEANPDPKHSFLKELRNGILCTICVWSVFCSVRIYISLHFLLILLVKLGFRLSVFWFFMFLFYLVFSVFAVQCFWIQSYLKRFNNLFSLYSNNLLKYKNRVIKTCFQRSLFTKKNAIYKEIFYSVHL